MTEEFSHVKVDLSLDATESANTVTQGLRKGVGKLFNAMMGKRVANVEYFQKLTAAQAEKDCLAIASGQAEFRDHGLIPTSALPLVQNQMLQIEVEQEMHNLAGNMRAACVALANVPDEDISDADIEPDFFARWRREAKVIGNAEVQKIWGKLLAEEVKSPNSISFRTLDVVKNLSRAEAELFCDAAMFVVNGNFLVCHQQNIGTAYKAFYRKVSTLLECGLVSTAAGQTKYPSQTRLTGTEKLAAIMRGYFIVNHTPNKEIMFKGTLLTTAGVELYSIAEFDPMPESYFNDFFRCIDNNSNVRIHPILSNGKIDLDHSIYPKEGEGELE